MPRGKRKKETLFLQEMYFLRLYVFIEFGKHSSANAFTSKETDKATIDIEAQEDGIVGKIIVSRS